MEQELIENVDELYEIIRKNKHKEKIEQSEMADFDEIYVPVKDEKSDTYLASKSTKSS